MNFRIYSESEMAPNMSWFAPFRISGSLNQACNYLIESFLEIR
jgi:hypothetical protein